MVICSQVCDSPRWFKGTPVMTLEESDLCSPPTGAGPPGDLDQLVASMTPGMTPTAAATVIYPDPTTPAPLPVAIPPPPTTLPPPTTRPPVTSSPPPGTSPLPTTPPPPATVSIQEFHTESYRVVTWSWYHSITRRMVLSEVPRVGYHTVSTLLALPAITPSTERPVTTMTNPPQTTGSVPAIVTSTMPKVQVVTTTTGTPLWVMDDLGSRQRGEVSAVGGAAVFCLWLFAGCLLLCVAAAACIVATLVGLVTWYRRVYLPLSVMLARRRIGGGEAVRLLTYSGGEEKGVAGGGVKQLYRSVLFIHREGGGAEEAGGGAMEGEGGDIEKGDGGRERLLVVLEPTGGDGGAGGGGATREEGREDKGLYRKTLFRPLSREEEIEGWRDVMEECRLPSEGGGRRGGGGVSRKRYSVILREEREESGGGREELDLVVGGWETGGQEESLGDWLAQYLPSMPRAVATPPEGEAGWGT